MKGDYFIFQFQGFVYLYFVFLRDIFYICLFGNLIYVCAYCKNTNENVIYTHMILNIFLLLIYNIYNIQWVSTQVLATYPIVNIQKYIHMVLVL